MAACLLQLDWLTPGVTCNLHLDSRKRPNVIVQQLLETVGSEGFWQRYVGMRCGESQASAVGDGGLRHSPFSGLKHASWSNNLQRSGWLVSHSGSTGSAMMKRQPKFVFSLPRTSDRLASQENDMEACRKLCETGHLTDAVDALDLLVQRGCHVPNKYFFLVLKRCIARKDLDLGRHIHALTVAGGYEGNAFLATHLIGLYASHAQLHEAMQVLSKVTAPTVYNWSAIILAYAKHGQATQAIRLYRRMRLSAIEPDNHIFLAVLKACATAGDLAAGKDVHAQILASARKPDMFVQSCLVDMYAKCGSAEDARRVFDTLPHRNVVTWTAMIAGYVRQGLGQEALDLYSNMQEEGLSVPNCVTFLSLLRACASIGGAGLQQGKQLQLRIQQTGLQDDVILGASLVNMYAKCGSLEDARGVFDKLPHRDVVTWNTMISGYAQQGMGQKALDLYDMMRLEGLCTPNSVTFVSLLQACASLGSAGLHTGKQLHAQIQDQGVQDDDVLGPSLVNMYAKCGSLEKARSVFDRLSHRNVVAWNAMVAGYVQQGMGQEALSIYRRMQQEGSTQPNELTFACLLQACASVGAAGLQQGKQLHAQIEEQGVKDDVVLGTALVTMYVKCCRSLEDARRVFDGLHQKDVVTWTAMITGYAQQGMGEEVLELYSRMKQEGIIAPDSVIFVSLLQAFANVGETARHHGKQLHTEIQAQGFQDDVVVGASLVTMYAKCGSIEDARTVFDELLHRNVVTWTAMIAGYVQQGMGEEALSLYSSMREEGIIPPDSVTFVCLLQACATGAALSLGKQLHEQIKEHGLEADVVVGTRLIDMYAKCGSMCDSQQVFDSLPERTVEAWSALIAGYTLHGDSTAVFELLDTMKLEGIQPDGITFLGVIKLCSHVGLIDKGWRYFELMTTEYGITPTVEHYVCMVDLLGRAGYLNDALGLAQTMPFQSDTSVWRALLGACQKWNNVMVGRQAFESAVSLDATDASPYIMMSNIYASAEIWDKAKEIEARRVESQAWKEPGQSWCTDMGGVVHKFSVGDKNHADNGGMIEPHNTWSS